MRTYEYRLYPNKQQQHLLMQCLSESRLIYNQMLEIVKAQYEEKGTFKSKYDLEKAFKGQGDHVPATTVQMLADRLSKSLKRFLAAKHHNLPGVGFPRFKTPNRWHSIQLRQYGKDGYLKLIQKSLSVRTHICTSCGFVADRDVNAAKNILKVARPGHGLQELTYTDGCRVS